MTDLSWGTADCAPYEPYGYARRIPSQKLICAAALLLSVPIGLDVLHSNSAPKTVAAAATPAVVAAMPAPVPHIPAAKPVQVAQGAALAPLRRYAAILDPNFVTGAKSASFGRVAALRSAFEPTRTVPLEQSDAAPSPVAAPAQVASLGTAEETEPSDDAGLAPMVAPAPSQAKEIPLPLPRPDFAAIPHAPANRRVVAALPATPSASVAPVAPGEPTVAPAAPTQGGSFFDKMFGAITRPSTALGYAAVEPGELGRPAIDRYTAVYDISAHTVTLPNGRKLEAHSGLGPYVDDPSSVALHMRGATPPNLYELTPREAIFHGVRALRLTPTGGTTYGRAGLLTHSYMLRGRSGESNGCVVFRNYEQFIAAYDAGMIRRLLVVAHAS
jgi:Protein of unknown function (DUF2778)